MLQEIPRSWNKTPWNNFLALGAQLVVVLVGVLAFPLEKGNILNLLSHEDDAAAASVVCA